MNQNNNQKQRSFVVSRTSSLKQAMQTITANYTGAVAVVDEQETLVGILSDGDIRRALLQEASLITPVEKIMNVNYVFYQQGMDETVAEFFKQNRDITILPVVDKNHKLLDVLTFKDIF